MSSLKLEDVVQVLEFYGEGNTDQGVRALTLLSRLRKAEIESDRSLAQKVALVISTFREHFLQRGGSTRYRASLADKAAVREAVAWVGYQPLLHQLPQLILRWGEFHGGDLTLKNVIEVAVQQVRGIRK